MADMQSGLEHELLKLPSESLAQLMRTEHKAIEQDLTSTLSMLQEVGARG